MPEPIHVPKAPCTTCPYVRATPPGVWHPDEYSKLPAYDVDHPPALAVFHCHQENATGVPTVCRGWLGVHADSVAVRFAQARGVLDPADVHAIPLEPDPTLYASGHEAAAAGLRGCLAPDAGARRHIDRLVQKGIGKP